jgi:hypothetical protein
MFLVVGYISCTLKLIDCDYCCINTNSNNDSNGSGSVTFLELGIPFAGIQKARCRPTLLIGVKNVVSV